MALTSRYAVLTGFVLSLVVSIVLHWQIFPQDIQGRHNWRQSQTMWNIRNFVHYDNDILNPRVSHFNGSNNNLLRLEFPLMQWGIAQVVRHTGHEVLVTRICVWATSVTGLVAFGLLLVTMGFSPGLALVGTTLLQFSPLFYFYSINVLPDVLALAAGIWYLYFLFAYFRDRRWWQVVAATLALGIATLAKLPFAMFGIVGLLYVLTRLFRRGGINGRLFFFAGAHLLFLLPAYKWYAWVMPRWRNSPTLYGIFGNTNTPEQNQAIIDYYWQQYFPFDLLSPAVWLLLLVGTLLPVRRRADFPYAGYVWALAAVTLAFAVLQGNTITMVHDYYLLPLLPWMYIVVAAGAERIWRWTATNAWKPLGIVLIAGALLAAPGWAYWLRQPLWAQSASAYYPVMRDVFNHQKVLREAVDDDAKVIVLNDVSYQIFTWLIRKRGYVFHGNAVRPAWIDDLHEKHGVDYLYSNSRRFDQDSTIRTRLDSLILEAGDIHVYRIADREP
ncbi:glycosyltransferase family 39 protein [Lewinella sp. JB7]|uniref:ArnT family glycosyltransferase n=1 Tax=Lewinella sp. JB7 TaxID=2962887 RepID=UPI0020C97429|nr:glycosyltransferase family 39 protein [Lewinella sp. JB7]MCP9236153.1 glycosyltransferase family 39 protein [Lewinella sp. JB7]